MYLRLASAAMFTKMEVLQIGTRAMIIENKSGALISGGQFVARLAENFELLIEETLQGLTVPARPARQEGDAGRVSKKALVARGGGDKDKEMPQAVSPPPRTSGERISRLEEEVHGMREVLQGQREVLDSTARDFSRFTTWTVTSLSRMMDGTGVTYTRYSESPIEYERRNIDLLTQEYKTLSISIEETIDSGFTRFNAIMTSLKSLDLDYSSKNHVRKFLHALPLKWRAKVMAIEESKDLATLPLDELVGNLKVYKMILQNDGVVSKTTTKDKVKSLALKAKVTKEQTSKDSDSQDGSDKDLDKEEKAEAFNLMDRNF
nr:UBN2 domain-containing protein [Tanacetum cinerariifolium]